MATKIWRGTAKAVPQVDWITPSNLNPGDAVTVTINRKDVTVYARTDTTEQGSLIADVVGKLVTAIGQYSNAEAEFAEVSAQAGVDAAGNTTHLIVTGPTTGKPVTMTASAAADAFEVIVQEVRRGVPAQKARQLLVPRGTATGGTFDLVYDGTTISTIAYNASAATLQTAINSGKAATSPTVTVTGDAGGPYTIATDRAVPVITVNGASLTGGDFVEVINGRDGLAAGLTIRVSRDAGETEQTQWRLSIGLDPGVSKPIAWIDSGATADEVAYALLSAGYHAAVRPSTSTLAQWDIELISDLAGIVAASLQVTIESEDSTYSVEEVTRTAVNEIQYLRLNATSGNIDLGGTTLAVDSGTFFSDDTTAGSLAKLIKDETGFDNTVSKIGTAANNYQGLIKIEFENGVEVSPLQITDASLAGGVFDTAVLNMGDPGVDEIQRVSFNRTPTGGTFTLTYAGNTSSAIAYNAGPGAMVTGLVSITGISSGDVEVSGPAGGPWEVTFTGNLAKTELVRMTGSGASLTGGLTPAFTLANQNAAESPNHWDVADNWYNPAAPTTPTKPAASDVVVFRNNSVDCLYELDDLAGSTLSSVIIEASYTGKLGLPEFTGSYYEYRQRRLKCGITTLEIGRGEGNGSPRLKIDLQAVACTATIFKTGSSTDNTHAVQLAGTSTSNVYNVLGGSVGIGTEDYSDTPAGNTLRIGAGADSRVATNVTVTGGTITTIEQTGGTSSLRCSATTFNLRGGQVTTDGTPTYTTFNCFSKAVVRSTGTITTLHLSTGGELDLSANAAGLTITNCNLYTGGNLKDPNGKATLSNGLNLVKCGLRDVVADIGKNKTFDVSESMGIL